MLHAWILFADAAEDAAKKAAEDAAKKDGPGFFGLAPFILIFIVFYFLFIRPGGKERQQRQLMINALKKNDKVITSGGIVGVVVNLKEGTEEVTIRSDETKLVVLRSSIARIITEPAKDAAKEAVTPKPTT
jgi:preprotein translocase subunit YajC